MNAHRNFLRILFIILTCIVSVSALAQTQSAPEWARGIVWYQILPDRFCNADTANDPKAVDIFPGNTDPWELSKWTSNWYQLTLKELLFSTSFYANAFRRQYGGDLDGIISKLDYLKDLGVTGLILNPVFESHSSHKFDHNSYHHIDKRLGPVIPVDTAWMNQENPEDPGTWIFTPADHKFLQLVKEVHQRGMKIVLDVQFAHVSANFWAFKDLLQKQERSQYVNWFYVKEWDRPETPYHSEFKYSSMWGIEAFPLFQKDTLGIVPGPKEYIYASTKRWMDPNGDGDPSDGIDGWRVDLISELPERFWVEWVKFVKSVNSQAVVISSEIDEKSAKKSPFDIIKTKTFAIEATSLLLNGVITPTLFDNNLTSDWHSNPYLVDYQINWINDHETDRLSSMCVNKSLPYEENKSPQKNPLYSIRKPNKEERNLQKLLLLLQFTWPGSPLIYFGDEAGMWGGDDPDCRKPMLWPESQYEAENISSITGDNTKYPVAFDSTIFKYYRELIALRNSHIALRYGTFKTLILDDVKMLYGYSRQSGADRVYIIFNASDAPQECRVHIGDVPEGVRVDAPLQGLSFFAEKYGLALVIPPKMGTILIPR